MLTPFRKIFTKDKDLTTVQSMIDNVLKSYEKVLLDGIVITATFSGVTTLEVEHKLGRLPQGWLVIDKSAKTDVWATNTDSRLLTLNVDNDVILKLYVF